MSELGLKALSLWQPWATGISLGLKKVETRGWETKHRGLLAIHAAKLWNKETKEAALRLFTADGLKDFPQLPKGAIVCVAELVDCVLMTDEFIAEQTEQELRWGDWRPGRYAWILKNAFPLDPPRSQRGRQGMFNVELELNDLESARVLDQISPKMRAVGGAASLLADSVDRVSKALKEGMPVDDLQLDLFGED